MSAEQDTAAKSGKKLSALLVLGGRDYHRGADTCCSPGFPPKTAHRSRQSISTARQQAAGGPWWSHSTTGIYCVLTMSAGPQKHYVITRRSSPVCPGGLDTDHGKNQSRDTQPADQAEGSGQPSTPPSGRSNSPGKTAGSVTKTACPHQHTAS